MQTTGVIIAILPEKRGTSQKGEWVSVSYVVRQDGLYPRNMVFDVLGADKISQFALHEGDAVTVYFEIDAREYNGRWYNSVRAYNVIKRNMTITPNMPQYQQQPTQQQYQQQQYPPQQQQLYDTQQPQNGSQPTPQQQNGGGCGDLPF